MPLDVETLTRFINKFCLVSWVVVDYQMQSSLLTMLDKLTERGQELYNIVLPSRRSLHEEGLVHISANSPVKRDTSAPRLVNEQFNWLVRVLPGLAAAQPHVEARLVEVNHDLVVVDQLCELYCEVQDYRFLLLQGLLVGVVTGQVLDAVLDVEVAEYLPAHLDVLGLLEQDAAVLQAVARPFVQRFLAKQIVLQRTL